MLWVPLFVASSWDGFVGLQLISYKPCHPFLFRTYSRTWLTQILSYL